MRNTREYIKFILSMVIWGTNGLLVANLALDTTEIVLIRTFLGALVLLIIVLATKSFNFDDLKADLVPATVGGIALGLNWMLLFAGYRTAGVGLSTLTYYCGPIIVLALSPVLFKEKLTGAKIAAIAAVAVGMVLITGDITPGSEVAKGIFFSAGAAVLYASIIISGKNIKRLSGLNCSLYELSLSFVVVIIFLLAKGTKLPVIPQKNELVYALIIGLVNTGFAYYLYFSSLQKLPGQTVALICYVDPLTSLFVSAVFLNEVLAAPQIVGAVLIMGGAMLGELKFKRKNKLSGG